MTLIERLNAARIAIGSVSKDGYNQHFKFKFQAWDDVAPAVGKALADAGVVVFPAITEVARDGDRTTVRMEFEVTDGEHEKLYSWYGEAKGNDDKAIQKAATSATKYFYLKLFLIGTKDEVADTDGDNPKGEQAKAAAKPLPENASWQMKEAESRRIRRDEWGITDREDNAKFKAMADVKFAADGELKPVCVAVLKAHSEGVSNGQEFYDFLLSTPTLPTAQSNSDIDPEAM